MQSCKKEKIKSNDYVVNEVITNSINYSLDTLKSKVEWKGYKIFKSENTNHFGEISFDSGNIIIKNGNISGGKFVIRIASLVNEDLAWSKEQQKDLESHLKSSDFFDVEKYPFATYEITRVSKGKGDYNTVLEGNMTIKDITKPMTINANFFIKDGKAMLFSEPTDFSRKEYGIAFASPIENGFIKDEITIQIALYSL